jgi:hypothetical protein
MACAGLTRFTKIMITDLAEILKFDPRGIVSHVIQNIGHASHVYIVSIMILHSKLISGKWQNTFNNPSIFSVNRFAKEALLPAREGGRQEAWKAFA